MIIRAGAKATFIREKVPEETFTFTQGRTYTVERVDNAGVALIDDRGLIILWAAWTFNMPSTYWVVHNKIIKRNLPVWF